MMIASTPNRGGSRTSMICSNYNSQPIYRWQLATTFNQMSMAVSDNIQPIYRWQLATTFNQMSMAVSYNIQPNVDGS